MINQKLPYTKHQTLNTKDQTPINVLLVEDSEDDYFITNMLLSEIKEKKFNLQWADSYEAALEKMRPNRYDVYLIDYQLGGRNGLELVKKILADGCTTPIIFLTGQGNESVAVEAMKLGAQDYLVKGTFTTEALNRAIDNAMEKVAMLFQIEFAHNKMLDELEQARVTQLALLPQEMPKMSGIKLAAKYVPMAQIGGDFYDILTIKKETFGIFIADVTGHGVSAALLSFLISGLFRNLAPEIASPAITLKTLDKALYQKMPDGKFATAFYCVYDAANQTLTYASAGHPPCYVVRPQTHEVFPLNKGRGTLLGILSPQKNIFREASFQLFSGDKLFLYTDGIIETVNQEEKLFGQRHLERLLRKHCSLPINELLETVHSHVLSYSRTQTLEDDITLFGLEVEE